MYDRSNRSGLLYEKIRYKKRKRETKKSNIRMSTAMAVPNENEMEELIEFFDSCVLDRDKKTVLAKMQESAMARKKSYQSSREMFDKCFHLYQLDSDLVRFFQFVLQTSHFKMFLFIQGPG